MGILPDGLTVEASLAYLDAECARRSLLDFSTLMSLPSYEQPDHVKLLIEYLEAMERREIRRLIVEMPPRSSKSTHVSRLFPAWWLGRHPTDGVIIASYGEELATDHGRAVRDILGNPLYPFETKLRADNRAAGRWGTKQGGGLLASGVGTGLTGFGGTLAVLDDPIKGREEADSELVRDHTWSWYQDVFSTRVQRDGVLLVTGTRWHEDDPIGRILNSPGASDWTRLRLPYVSVATEAEPDQLGRAAGEVLPIFGLVPRVDKGEISAYSFASLYQQNPIPAGGGVFKSEWMQRRYSPADLVRARSSPRWVVIQSVDLGGKQGVGHDPSAIATWGFDGISKYLLDYWSAQDEYADVKARIKAKNFEWRPRMLYVEDATWAQPLISDLRREGGVRVYPVTPRGSKWTRADAVSPEFEGGAVVLPQSADWLDGWMHEHLSFPNGQHDEAVDTTSLALSMLSRSIGRPRRVTLREQELPNRNDGAQRMLARIKERRRG